MESLVYFSALSSVYNTASWPSAERTHLELLAKLKVIVGAVKINVKVEVGLNDCECDGWVGEM